MTTLSPPRRRLRVIVRWILIAVAMVVAAAVATAVAIRFIEAKDQTGVFSTAGRVLLGQEEFDGPAGAKPNPDYFDYDVGNAQAGWGNGEVQAYTRSTDNARLSGDGNLIIEAHRSGDQYTSARLVTRGKASFANGLLEARIKMPAGQGLHPAFWLLGHNVKTIGWPASGEIDVMELVNSGDQFHNAIHGPLASDRTQQWKLSFDGDAPSNLADDFHVYQVYREDGLIRIAIDGEEVGDYSRVDVPADAAWVFDSPMYLTLNIAVGGSWPGPVGPQTVFPARMLVDWVRYWN